MTRTNSLDLLQQEILQAKAEALGSAGRKLRDAIEQYRKLKSTIVADGDDAARARLDALWEAVFRARENLIVLREGIGLRRHDSVDSEFDIPLRHREQP